MIVQQASVVTKRSSGFTLSLFKELNFREYVRPRKKIRLQYKFAHGRQLHHSLGEMGLVSAVVERAIRDLFGNDDLEAYYADEFIFNTSIQPFSFNWCMDMLNLESDEIKRKILELKQGAC